MFDIGIAETLGILSVYMHLHGKENERPTRKVNFEPS
jgi:hypothetical protein